MSTNEQDLYIDITVVENHTATGDSLGTFWFLVALYTVLRGQQWVTLYLNLDETNCTYEGQGITLYAAFKL